MCTLPSVFVITDDNHTSALRGAGLSTLCLLSLLALFKITYLAISKNNFIFMYPYRT